MKRRLSIIINILILSCTIAGIIVMFVVRVSVSGLISNGIENFKYYTVLSNVACGAVAGFYLFGTGKDRRMPNGLVAAKLMSATAVTLTFLTIALFLGLIYGHAILYRGSNFFFHLIIPVLAIIDFMILDTRGRIPFRYAVYSAMPTVIYGCFYAVNLFVNGIGQWPETNDWYGFVNWGYPVGFAIFGMITLATFGIACILRAIKK